MKFPAPSTGNILPDYDNLFLAEWPGMVRYLSGRVRDEGLAEDLAQETFLRAAQGLAGFRGQSSPRTWLRRIADNALRDYRRSPRFKEANALRPDPPRIDALPASSRESPALAVERRHLQNCLGDLVARLPAGERDALMLAVRDGMPPREIASKLQMDPGAARARLYRARRKLARLVAARCVLVTDEAGGLSCEARAHGAAMPALRPDPVLPA